MEDFIVSGLCQGMLGKGSHPGGGSVWEMLERRFHVPVPVPAVPRLCAGAAGWCRRLPVVFIYQKQMMVVQSFGPRPNTEPF